MSDRVSSMRGRMRTPWVTFVQSGRIAIAGPDTAVSPTTNANREASITAFILLTRVRDYSPEVELYLKNTKRAKYLYVFYKTSLIIRSLQPIDIFEYSLNISSASSSST